MSSIQSRLSKFLSSPPNQTGLIIAGSSIVGFVTQYFDHNLALSAMAASVAGTFAGIFWKDNTVLQADIVQLVKDSVTAEVAKNVSAIPLVVHDVGKVIEDATTGTTTVIVNPPATPVVTPK